MFVHALFRVAKLVVTKKIKLRDKTQWDQFLLGQCWVPNKKNAHSKKIWPHCDENKILTKKISHVDADDAVRP